MNKNMKNRMTAVFSAFALLLTSSVGAGISLPMAKADYLNSVTIELDEGFENLNLLTRTKGTYTADMVYRMIYDRLFTLEEDEGFSLELLQSCELMETEIEGGDCEIPSIDGANITNIPGWEIPIIPNSDPLLIDRNNDTIFICKLWDDIQFQNGEALTVQSLINLINFAKLQPQNTLIYQTWAPVVITPIDDYEFYLGVNTEDFNFGFMDVMYNLASPQGSIVYVDDTMLDVGYPVGTGAYELQQVDGNGQFVQFERWEDWWNTETIPTQYVTFNYVADSQSSFNSLMGEYCEVAVMRFGGAQEEMIRSFFENNNESWQQWQNIQIEELEGNPLALFFNTDSQQSIFGEAKYRRAVSAALNKDELHIGGGLKEQSNDFWCNLSNRHGSSTLPVNNLIAARNLIEEAGGIEDDSVINVVVYNSSYFSNVTYREYYSDLVSGLQENLNAFFEDYNCTVCVVTESEVEASDGGIIGDIFLKEIDLHNVNSAYNTLYGKGSADLDICLDFACSARDKNTFKYGHFLAQYCNYMEEACVTNLGWQQRAVIRNENVSGISVCTGFCPTGDSSMLDFRFIAVTANG